MDIPGLARLTVFVPEHRGHDDLLKADALMVQAQPVDRIRTAMGRRRAAREEVV